MFPGVRYAMIQFSGHQIIAFWVICLAFTQLSCHASKLPVNPASVGSASSDSGRLSPEKQLQVQDTQGFAVIRFDSSAYQFGAIRKGTVLEKEIFFANIGSVPLVIDQMTACECTTLDFTRLPIPPGARVPLKIRYDSKDKSGPQIVDIDIIANTQSGYASVKFFLLVQE